MALDILPALSRRVVVLASKSPRRKEILEQNAGLANLVIQPSQFEETLDKSRFATPADYVIENARQKALSVYETLRNKNSADLIIGCDTVVVHNNTILEKPEDRNHAREMIQNLSGSEHYVVSGVCLLVPKQTDELQAEPIVSTFAEHTTVVFGDLEQREIEAYVDTGEPYDKAGGYGYQGRASVLVKRIEGCYYNVVGFPLYSFTRRLKQLVTEHEEVHKMLSSP
eukprot:gb/GECG01002447.1/.p1 GENE.gb/GECG01002447.1/~~gb/GECG01002447.1/.p1  ORF type:complete len:226 (+),score=18.11 gb/GECG01002447.1/:1-678(+)